MNTELKFNQLIMELTIAITGLRKVRERLVEVGLKDFAAPVEVTIKNYQNIQTEVTKQLYDLKKEVI